MFHIFHGWKNGPKCKKLIRNLQCRLERLKCKRSHKAKQLCEEISQLLHLGLQHHALDKAEKLFKNQHEVTIYDLLDYFCEFMIKFSCISKYNYSANDINQAVSSLIFSSSRLRGLPELIQLRKLFRNFYGERFANVALHLLPGNIVNQQIKDCIIIISESVSLEMKFRIMNEIARNRLKSRPLLIDHPGADSSHEGEETSEDETWSLEIDDKDVEARIFHMDSSSESQSCIRQLVHSSGSISTSSPFSDSVESLIVTKEERELEFEDRFDVSDCEFIDLVPRTSLTTFKDQIYGVEEIGFSVAVETSSESSASFRDEVLYSDGIEEYESSVRIEGSIQDQRAFNFSQRGVSRIGKLEHLGDKYYEEHFKKKHLKRKSRRKLRKRSVSVEKGCMFDSETSHNRNCGSEESKFKDFVECCAENPCYLCKSGVDHLIYRYLKSLSQEEKEEFIQDGLICTRALSMLPEMFEKLGTSGDKYHKEHCKKKHLSKESRKSSNLLLSKEKGSMIDSESGTYYGIDPSEISQYKNCVNEESSHKMFDICSEENPCYLCKTEGEDYLISQSFESLSLEEKEEFIQDGLICMRALSTPRERLETLGNSGDVYHKEHCKKKHLNRQSRNKLRKSSISAEKVCMLDSESSIYYGVDFYETSRNKNHANEESRCKKLDKCSEANPCYLCKTEGIDYLISQSFECLSPEEKEEFIQDGLICMRALSMPPEKHENYDFIEISSSISGSNSFPITTSTCHVHPKLSDYDDLTTRFITLDVE